MRRGSSSGCGIRVSQDSETQAGRLLPDLWAILSRRQRHCVLWAQLLSIVMAFSTVAGVAAIAPFFAVLGDGDLIERSSRLHWLYTFGGFSSKRVFEVALGLGFCGFVVLANLINVAGSYLMTRLAWQISIDLQSTLFAEYLRRPYLFHAQTHSAVLFNNIVYETTRATNEILQNIFLLVTNLVTAVLVMLSVLLLNPRVAVGMILALAGGYALFYAVVRDRLLQAGEAQSRLFTQQTRVVNESLGAIKEILVMRIQRFFRDDFARASQQFARAAIHTQLVGQSPRYLMECVAVAGLVVAALIAGREDEGIGPLLGQLTFLGFAAYRLRPILQQAYVAVVRIRANRRGFGNIADDLRLARARGNDDVAAVPGWRGLPRREIQLDRVSFNYETGRGAAVSEVSLCIPAGAAVGFVGANGSGKTTLVDLIAGLLVPASGTIAVDGAALDDSNRTAWQHCIAYVPQSVFLLDTSIAQNVALGVPLQSIDRQRVMEAAKLAQLDELVATLPGGYDHFVGERGVRLSGGQRQRIGIARALYTDASVLILDEATNAQDGLSERELMTTLLRLRGRCTIILIAHRLSTVRSCDVIFEFQQGRLEASGTYERMVGASDTFRRSVGAASGV
jgi:ATP-binding cassette, subfamily B, bacterial PglK